jgi:hypothetical protein
MNGSHTRGETHGCIVCGRLHQLYVVYDAAGDFHDFTVMSSGARKVEGAGRPLVACERHSEADVSRAVERAYGKTDSGEDP